MEKINLQLLLLSPRCFHARTFLLIMYDAAACVQVKPPHLHLHLPINSTEPRFINSLCRTHNKPQRFSEKDVKE
jgi:hypothetical protein